MRKTSSPNAGLNGPLALLGPHRGLYAHPSNAYECYVSTPRPPGFWKFPERDYFFPHEAKTFFGRICSPPPGQVAQKRVNAMVRLHERIRPTTPTKISSSPKPSLSPSPPPPGEVGEGRAGSPKGPSRRPVASPGLNKKVMSETGPDRSGLPRSPQIHLRKEAEVCNSSWR